MADPYGARALSSPEPAGAVDDGEWSIDDAADLYRIRSWGDDYFFIDERGRVAVQTAASEPAIVIADVVRNLRARGTPFPVLLRFQDVLRAQVVRLQEAFATAIADAGYGNRYRGVYPIKVNQLHEVVEEVLEAGQPYGLGLECGSKPELIAALPHLQDDDALLICNGVKDAMMLRLMIAAQSIGKNVIPVIEKYNEFDKVANLSREAGRRPWFGVRIRLGTSGSGKWAESGGDLSKFGISVPELMQLVERLPALDAMDGLVLLHFHLGSQVADIQFVKQAVKEITYIYAQLVKRGVGVRYLDVGGGLGVNYEAGYYDTDVGINYNLQEYANAVVYTVKEIADAKDVPHPTIVSESGRALTAHHSVLVVPVLGSYRKDRIDSAFKAGRRHHAVIRALYRILSYVEGMPGPKAPPRIHELIEAYHDAAEKREEADTLFAYGYLTLEDKAIAERLYWSICASIRTVLVQCDLDEPVPPELQALDEHLVDQYLCNFSIFQSILDHWSIGQGFPIMPLERLDEPPGRRAVLVDLTCDSDGKVSHYVSSNPDKRFLQVHGIRDDQTYYLGFFLMGAYQDIMGDSHNLFGRVAEAHVYADAEEPGSYYIEKIIPATTVQDMLAAVQYFPNDLHRRMNDIIRRKIEAGVIRPRAGVDLLEQYMQAFGASTYYTPDD